MGKVWGLKPVFGPTPFPNPRSPPSIFPFLLIPVLPFCKRVLSDVNRYQKVTNFLILSAGNSIVTVM